MTVPTPPCARLLGALFALIAVAPGSSAAPLTGDLPSATAPALSEHSGPVGLPNACEVTVQARNGFSSHPVIVLLEESEVRTRVGWWSPINAGERASVGQVSPPPGPFFNTWLAPGESVSVTGPLPLACNARRRYRVRVVVFRPDAPPPRLGASGRVADLDGRWGDVAQEATLYHPTADGFTQEPVLRLGDLRRLFPGLEGVPGEGPPGQGTASVPEAPAPPTNPASGPAEGDRPPPSDRIGAGEQILSAVDFGDAVAPGLPHGMEYVGGALRVVDRGGRSTLEMDREGHFRVPLPTVLPDRFTFEFLYHAPHRFSTLLVAPHDPSTATRGPSAPHYRPVRAHHFVLSPEGIGNGVRPGLGADDLPSAVHVSERHREAYVDRPALVQGVVDGESAALYFDGELVANLPRATFERADAVEFYYKGGRGAAYVGDIVISGDTGSPAGGGLSVHVPPPGVPLGAGTTGAALPMALLVRGDRIVDSSAPEAAPQTFGWAGLTDAQVLSAVSRARRDAQRPDAEALVLVPSPDRASGDGPSGVVIVLLTAPR